MGRSETGGLFSLEMEVASGTGDLVACQGCPATGGLFLSDFTLPGVFSPPAV
jgi:hypothetical protein